MEANAGGRGGGRRPGATNYKPNILMDLIAERKPVSNDEWVAVANYYQELSELGRAEKRANYAYLLQ